VKTHQKMGLRAYDLGLSPIVVMADEIGSLVASMDSKQKKEFLALVTQIVQKGRSVSCFAIFGTQSPKTDTTLSSDIRSQFATKIL
ncbi:cell division protein FtsK, partial [Streptococcus thermophilus]|nr:cell division protein FtsK [Streptococcus thermophilus]